MFDREIVVLFHHMIPSIVTIISTPVKIEFVCKSFKELNKLKLLALSMPSTSYHTMKLKHNRTIQNQTRL